MKNNYNLLKQREIISILIGDRDKTYEEGQDIYLKYLSGPSICDLSSKLGNPLEYSWQGGALSRWQYMSNLLDYCIENNKCNILLSHLFQKENFIDFLKKFTTKDIEKEYNNILQIIFERINKNLYFGGHELEKIGNQYIIKKIGTKVEIDIPTIKIIDMDYIKELSGRANKDVNDSNYDSAITKSRTMLEEVFIYVIEGNRIEPSNKGDIGKLYNQVKNIYKMHQSKEMDKRVNCLLGGLEKILFAIGEMRNKNSDSHGVGSKRINIDDYHARLFVNAAKTFSEFILSVHKKNKGVNND